MTIAPAAPAIAILGNWGFPAATLDDWGLPAAILGERSESEGLEPCPFRTVLDCMLAAEEEFLGCRLGVGFRFVTMRV